MYGTQAYDTATEAINLLGSRFKAVSSDSKSAGSFVYSYHNGCFRYRKRNCKNKTTDGADSCCDFKCWNGLVTGNLSSLKQLELMLPLIRCNR